MKQQKTVFTLKIPITVKQDRGTWIMYNKKYNISGYGKTKMEAREMFQFCVNDILNFKKTIANEKGSL